MKWVHERTEVHRTIVNFVGLNFTRFNKDFRRIRKRNKGCQLCRKAFADGQLLHLGFTDKGNKLMCDDCTDKAIKHGVEHNNEIDRLNSVESN